MLLINFAYTYMTLKFSKGKSEYQLFFYICQQPKLNIILNVIYNKCNNIMSDRLTYKEKEALPDSVFGLPERREYPMPDAAHVRAAEAYFRYCPEELKPRLAKAILARAKEFGVDVESQVIKEYAQQ